MNSGISETIDKAEKKTERLVKAAEMGLFPIGTEVVCECMQNCGNVGIIIGYDFEESMYQLNHGCAFFEYARKLTKLEQALK